MEKVPRHYHTLPRTPERGAVRRQFALAPCRADVRDPFMRIRVRTAVSGKMLENRYDARVVQAVRKSRPMRGDGLRISRKTASETAYGR